MRCGVLRLLACLLALCLSAGPGVGIADEAAAEPGDGIEQRVRLTKMAEAALRAVEASIDDLRYRLASDREIANSLLADVPRHARASLSRQRMRDRERDKLEEAFAEQLRFFAHHSEDWPPRWAEQVMAGQRERVGSAIDGLLAAHFTEAYTRGRRQAVARQAKSLEGELRPAPEEVEAMAGSADDFMRLNRARVDALAARRGAAYTSRQTVRLRGGGGLFEENEAALEQRLTRVLARSLETYWSQLRAVANHDGAGARERDDLRQAMLEDARRLSSRPGEPSAVIYPLTRARIQLRSLELEEQLFADFVRRQLAGSCPGLPAERVIGGSDAQTLPSRFETHRAERTRALLEDTRQRLVSSWVAPVRQPAAREGLAGRARDWLEGRDPFEEGFGRCLAGPLRELRLAEAQREIAARYPSIADGSFELRDHAIERLQDGLPLDPGDFPDGRSMRLEESAQELARLREIHVAEARSALQGQLGLAGQRKRREHYRTLIAIDVDRSDARRRHWQLRYEREVVAAWSAAAKSAKYQRALPPTSRRIADIIAAEWRLPGETAGGREAPQPAASPSPAAPAAEHAATDAQGSQGSAGGSGSGTGDQSGGSPGTGNGEDPPEQDRGEDEKTGCAPDAAALHRCLDVSAACQRALGRCELCLGASRFCVDLRGDCGEAVETCRQARTRCEQSLAGSR